MTPEKRPNLASKLFKNKFTDKLLKGVDNVADKMIYAMDNIPGLDKKNPTKVTSQPLETAKATPEIKKSLGLNIMKLDALITLGHNIGAGWSGDRIRRNPDHLSRHSKISAEAAAVMYNEGYTGKIIYSSGPTAGEPTEARAMKTFILKRHPEIPESDILTENVSIDTAGNAEESRKIVMENNFRNVGLMSTKDHVGNSATLFRRYRLNIQKESIFASEFILAKNMERNNTENHPKNPQQFLKNYRGSIEVRKDGLKEFIRWGMLHTIDPKGMLLRQVSKRTRK